MLNVKFKATSKAYVFEVLKAVLRQIQVFWDVTLCSKRRGITHPTTTAPHPEPQHVLIIPMKMLKSCTHHLPLNEGKWCLFLHETIQVPVYKNPKMDNQSTYAAANLISQWQLRNRRINFDVLLTVHLSIFISVINQLDGTKFLFYNKFYFMPLHVSSTMCSSSGGQNYITQTLV